MSRGLEWLKVGSMVVTSAVSAARAVIEYRKYRSEREAWEVNRRLQDRAWKQVLEGELHEARVGHVRLRAPASRSRGVSSDSSD